MQPNLDKALIDGMRKSIMDETIPTKDALAIVFSIQEGIYLALDEIKNSQRKEINEIKKRSLGYQFAEHKTAAILLLSLIFTILILAPDLLVPIAAKALGIPLP